MHRHASCDPARRAVSGPLAAPQGGRLPPIQRGRVCVLVAAVELPLARRRRRRGRGASAHARAQAGIVGPAASARSDAPGGGGRPPRPWPRQRRPATGHPVGAFAERVRKHGRHHRRAAVEGDHQERQGAPGRPRGRRLAEEGQQHGEQEHGGLREGEAGGQYRRLEQDHVDAQQRAQPAAAAAAGDGVKGAGGRGAFVGCCETLFVRCGLVTYVV